MHINLNDITTQQAHHFLQYAIAPRPIAFVSSIDANGSVNLSPFSFFNLFSTNPPIVIFSPSRRVRNNTTKHTLENVKEVPEVVINIVTCYIVQQVSLASCEYPKGTDEFIKAGFTKEKATLVRPPMVKESQVKMECKVLEIKPVGNEGGAGNLVICEVLCMHMDDSILNKEGTMIDQTKLHHVARLGGDWYCKVTEQNLFKVAKPSTKLGIGFDNLPLSVLHSNILTGNHLAQLANVEAIPEPDASFNNVALLFILKEYKNNVIKMNHELHLLAARLLNNGLVEDAWQVLLREVSPTPEEELLNTYTMATAFSEERDLADPLQGLGTDNHKIV
ncbi:flavin reductase family protein [Ilyomonas limi]|uniref:Flavin reductase family protein n=1 Tax=Ilyomonas limi TaxID=2575867 RepID=A0A4U3L8K0_9BACT|nr:flavin reductase family protein [Ilyomonas limi]TKK70236.1 flavin reductase family protein [Ilyomonas limi]